jgi:hypothetical protein
MMDFKVVCVSNTVNGGVIIDIEIGKVYEVKEYDFKRLNEFRNERLSEIGL